MAEADDIITKWDEVDHITVESNWKAGETYKRFFNGVPHHLIGSHARTHTHYGSSFVSGIRTTTKKWNKRKRIEGQRTDACSLIKFVLNGETYYNRIINIIIIIQQQQQQPHHCCCLLIFCSLCCSAGAIFRTAKLLVQILFGETVLPIVCRSIYIR